jgi:hypothetical protein
MFYAIRIAHLELDPIKVRETDYEWFKNFWLAIDLSL